MFEWTKDQERALRAIATWRNDRDQQVFKVYGYAGTGKTTLIKHLTKIYPATAVMAYTGKAANVLQEKGIGHACTIHSAIMRPLDKSEQDLDALNNKIAKTEAALKVTPAPLLRQMLRQLKEAVAGHFAPAFVLNEQSKIMDSASFVICDEVSMVGQKLADSLLSFRKPILVFGDPGQLGPIKDEESILSAGKPDIMIKEVTRQARDNPIIRQSMRVRDGLALQTEGTVRVLERYGPTDYELTEFDQVITGMRTTRRMANKSIRKSYGLEVLPTGADEEKIICLNNDAQFGIFNGQQITLEDVQEEDERNLSAVVWREAKYCTEAEKPIGRATFWKGHFENTEFYQEDRLSNDERFRKVKGFQADWAFALTCHKAQGSAWRNVALLDDGFQKRQPDARKRWLYTALTRASEAFTMIKGW